VTSGKIFIKGREVTIKNPRHAIQLGLGYIPDERRTLGLNMKFDIKENTVLPSMNKFRKFKLFQNHRAEARAAYDINEKLELNYQSLWQKCRKTVGW